MRRFRNFLFVFTRYLIAGGCGFALDYVMFAICFEILGWHYLVSAAFGFIVGLTFVYLACNIWVFNARKMANRPVTEFFIFSIIGLIGLFLTLLLMWFFTDVCGLYALISKLFTVALVLMWNFGIRKIILY